jgi:hypothetical protein
MKLRKIAVDDNVYLYVMTGKVNFPTREGTLTIKIFLKDYKLTPLLVDFLTWDDPIIGFPLNFGFPLLNSLTNEKEMVNLNRPKYVRECILYGLQKGWTGKNKLEPLDGLKVLSNLGYDVSVLSIEKADCTK